MFRIVDFKLLIRIVAILTTIITIVAYNYISSNYPNNLNIMSISGVVALVLIFFISSNFIARPIWKVVTFFNRSLYPDINGTWEGKIITESKEEIPVRVLIKQSLLDTKINVHTATSKSQTLESTPVVESGEAKLYYMYRSLPKDPTREIYTGTTIFDVRRLTENNKTILELSGYYYTDRKTVGRISFKQVGKDTNKDISYY